MGSIILGLGNGTVEAYINPIVATMFNKEKTKWLNILHAGWPGGLVVGGLLTAALGKTGQEQWLILIALGQSFRHHLLRHVDWGPLSG